MDLICFSTKPTMIFLIKWFLTAVKFDQLVKFTLKPLIRHHNFWLGAAFFYLVGEILNIYLKFSLRPVEYDTKKSLVRSLTDCWQLRLQVERVVRIRENRYKIHLKNPILPSIGQILIKLISCHTKSTIPDSTRWVSTAVKNLTSR